MAGAVADKIRNTQNSFPPRTPGAVEPCPNAKPVLKENPLPVDVTNAFALTQNIQQTLGAGNRVEQKAKKDWIEILLVDLDGKPVPNVRYRITLPDGAVQEGRLNEHGQAGYYKIEAGECKVTFPDLDKDAWD